MRSQILRHALGQLGLVFFLSAALLSCSSNEVIVDKPAPADVQADPVPPNPAYQRLMELFQSQNYEGVGMQFESDETLDLLYKVFSDQKTWNREIALVYTGLQMSYDNRHKSLTVGGTTSVTAILGYIQKHIPLKNSPK